MIVLNLWQRIIKWWASEPDSKLAKLPTLFDQVENARREWAYSENFFNNVLDKELVDYAVHSWITAEQRYLFLLKLARREGLTQRLPRIEYYGYRR